MISNRSRRRWFCRPWPLCCLSGLLALGTGACGLVNQSVTRLVEPRQYAAEAWMNEITSQPEKSGFHLKPFTVRTSDGLNLKAMILTPAGAAGSTDRGLRTAALKQAGLPPAKGVRGTLMLLHGFNARKEHMLPFAERMCAAGFRCVIYDSRGHGDSEGDYATFGTRETDDPKRVLAAAREQVGAGGLGPVGLLGYSMGGAVALQAQPSLPEVKALASISTFAVFRDVITKQASLKYRGWGRPLLPLVRHGASWRAGFDPWSIRPDQVAARLTCPLFLAHGAEDALIRVDHVHRLAAAGGARVQQVMVIPKATHGSVFSIGGDALWNALAVFFVQAMPAGSAAGRS